MTKRKAALKVGDVVSVAWDDHRGFERTLRTPDELRLAEFVTYGRVHAIETDRILVDNELEASADTPEPHRCHEPVAIGLRMITRITVFAPSVVLDYGQQQPIVRARILRNVSGGLSRRTSRRSARSRKRKR